MGLFRGNDRKSAWKPARATVIQSIVNPHPVASGKTKSVCKDAGEDLTRPRDAKG